MRRTLAAAAAALLLVGCGSSADDLSPATATALGPEVDAITAAARADDEVRVQQLLGRLRTRVEQLEASGDLSPERGARVLAAAARVATDVGAPEPRVVVSVQPAPPAPREDEGEKKGSDKGEDKEDKDDKDDKDDDD